MFIFKARKPCGDLVADLQPTLHGPKPLQAAMTNSNIRQHKVAQNNILTLAAEAASVLECLYKISGCRSQVSAELAPRALSRVMAPT